MAESARGQYEANPFLIGGYPSGQEGLTLTELSALVPQEKSSLVGYLLNPLLTKPGTHNPE